MNDSEGAALFAAIQENPADLAPRLIYSDWLEENGRVNEALALRGRVAASKPIFDYYGSNYGSGDRYGLGCGLGIHGRGSGGCGLGDGYGDGDGHGYGSGDTVSGRYGTGYGSVDGSGDGHGYGRGDMDGHGAGEGYQDGYEEGDPYQQWPYYQQPYWENFHKKLTEGKPAIGKQMLIWCGGGFAWIGHVDEIYAPGCYKLSNAGMLCRVKLDSWLPAASGAARDNYVYRHAPDGIVYTGPELHGAVEWKGELPGQDVR